MTDHALVPDDDITHEPNVDCPCGPTPQSVICDDGTIGWVYVHHSLDGREKQE